MWYILALTTARTPVPFTRVPAVDPDNNVALFCVAVPEHAPADEARRVYYEWQKKYAAIDAAGQIGVVEPPQWPDLPEDVLTPEQRSERFLLTPAFEVGVAVRFTRFDGQDLPPVLQ